MEVNTPASSEVLALRELQTRVESARSSLEKSADFDMSFGYVIQILSMFGPRLESSVLNAKWGEALGVNPDENRASLLGWQRRAWSALLCADKILPFWSVDVLEPYLNLEELQQLRQVNWGDYLANAKACVLLKEACLVPELEVSTDELDYILSSQGQKSPVVAQCTSVYRTLEQILRVVHSDEPGVIDSSKTHFKSWKEEVDWKEYPSPILAAFAYAGVPNEHSRSFNDPQARHEFWLWWLDEAIPASWDLEDLDANS